MTEQIIIFEGPSGVGKSTQASMLVDSLSPKASLVEQPSDTNSVRFLKNLCKQDESLKPFERQLLYAITQVVDVYEFLTQGSPIKVMDRCYMSSYVYGTVSGLTSKELSILVQTYNEVYKRNLPQDVKVDIFLLDKTEEDPTELWKSTRAEYHDIVKIYSENSLKFISENENIHILDCDGLDEKEVHLEVLSKLEKSSPNS